MDGPPASHAALVVRPAREADVDRLLEIHLAAFPDPRSVETRRRVFLHNRLGGLEHLRVAEHGSELVGHAFSFPVGVWFGGRVVHGRAIASVGVAIEARGRGVARALLGALHEEASAGSSAFTLLYPFRQGFYARMGYAPLARQRILTVSPRAIPAEWRLAHAGEIRRADGRDRPEIARVYSVAARSSTGYLERDSRAWEHDFLEERRQWLVLDAGGELAGYAAVKLVQSEPHAEVHAHVSELVAIDAAARRRLMAAVAALGDQAHDVTLAVADDDPLDWALVDGDRHRGGTTDVEHALGVVATGPMLKLCEAAAALSARGYAGSGCAALRVEGEDLVLEVSEGAGHAARGVSTPGVSTLVLSRAALASVAFGGLRVEDAVRLGWARGSDEAVQAASALLALPPFSSLDSF